VSQRCFGLWRAHRAATAQILRDRSRGNQDSRFQLQLIGDAFLSPGGIVCRHLADQRLEVLGQARSARSSSTSNARRGAIPGGANAGACRLGRSRARCAKRTSDSGRHHPAGGIVGPPRPDLPLLEQGQLLSQEKVLGHQRRPRTCSEGNGGLRSTEPTRYGPVWPLKEESIAAVDEFSLRTSRHGRTVYRYYRCRATSGGRGLWVSGYSQSVRAGSGSRSPWRVRRTMTSSQLSEQVNCVEYDPQTDPAILEKVGALRLLAEGARNQVSWTCSSFAALALRRLDQRRCWNPL
jgi:hypothetical protein